MAKIEGRGYISQAMAEEVDAITMEQRVTVRVSSQHTGEVQFGEEILWREHKTVGSLLFSDR